MKIYCLSPTDPNHPSWSNSTENEGVWACASTTIDARALVAEKTGAPGSASPWQDQTVTSCIEEPSMSHIGAGTVVRADGSTVGQ